jgi:hypothetical protein
MDTGNPCQVTFRTVVMSTAGLNGGSAGILLRGSTIGDP